jgi:hypothetical protein
VAQSRPKWMGTLAGARRPAMVAGSGILLALALTVAACEVGGQSTASNPNMLALTQVPWCDVPAISFQDNGKLSHPIISDWNVVKGQLGFTPYLPSQLPKDSCLALAGGSIHDPIFGGRLRVTYNLPTVGPLSFSEAPKHAGQAGNLSDKVQCSQAAPTSSATPTASAGGTPTPGATPAPALAVCLGAIANTNVSIASAQPTGDLERLFISLQPNVDWVPQVASQTQATPTATATSAP